MYKKMYGHRGSLENYLIKPRLYEDETLINEQLTILQNTDANVVNMLEKTDQEFQNTWEHIKSKLKKPCKIKALLEDIDQTCILREAVRSELTRVVGVIRHWYLHVSELTGLGDGIFFLAYQEVIDVLSGDVIVTKSITKRRKVYEKYKSLPITPSWIKGKFDPEKWADDPERRIDIFDSSAPLPDLDTSDIIKGIPGSAGRIEGVVRRINTPEEGYKVQHGEILVTSTTNIGWTPLFPKISAVITDVGAALSHAAIIARELGIPAVVGCTNATVRLKTGDKILLDGEQGIIKILEKKEET
jgi:pyruvate,water dikinase